VGRLCGVVVESRERETRPNRDQAKSQGRPRRVEGLMGSLYNDVRGKSLVSMYAIARKTRREAIVSFDRA
jgi:hypothetical protein